MSISSIHAHRFYEEVADRKIVYTIRDNGGYIAPKNFEGIRSMPFWSSESRAKKIIDFAPVYKDFWIEKLSFKEFKKWCKSLKKDGHLVGVNWSGKNVKGYDIQPDSVLNSIKSYSKIKLI